MATQTVNIADKTTLDAVKNAVIDSSTGNIKLDIIGSQLNTIETKIDNIPSGGESESGIRLKNGLPQIYDVDNESWEYFDVGGIRLAGVTNFEAFYVVEGLQPKIMIRWVDPNDITSGGQIYAKFGGTLIVRKEGSAPSSPNDGVIVCRTGELERNKYKATVDKNSIFVPTGTSYSDNLLPEGAQDCDIVASRNKILNVFNIHKKYSNYTTATGGKYYYFYEWFCDTDIEFGKTYYYRAFPTTVAGVISSHEDAYAVVSIEAETPSWITSDNELVIYAIQSASEGLCDLKDDFGWTYGDKRNNTPSFFGHGDVLLQYRPSTRFISAIKDKNKNNTNYANFMVGTQGLEWMSKYITYDSSFSSFINSFYQTVTNSSYTTKMMLTYSNYNLFFGVPYYYMSGRLVNSNVQAASSYSIYRYAGSPHILYSTYISAPSTFSLFTSPSSCYYYWLSPFYKAIIKNIQSNYLMIFGKGGYSYYSSQGLVKNTAGYVKLSTSHSTSYNYGIGMLTPFEIYGDVVNYPYGSNFESIIYNGMTEELKNQVFSVSAQLDYFKTYKPVLSGILSNGGNALEGVAFMSYTTYTGYSSYFLPLYNGSQSVTYNQTYSGNYFRSSAYNAFYLI